MAIPSARRTPSSRIFVTVSANIGNDAPWDRIKEVEAHKVISAIADEFRALAEELHYW